MCVVALLLILKIFLGEFMKNNVVLFSLVAVAFSSCATNKQNKFEEINGRIVASIFKQKAPEPTCEKKRVRYAEEVFEKFKSFAQSQAALLNQETIQQIQIIKNEIPLEIMESGLTYYVNAQKKYPTKIQETSCSISVHKGIMNSPENDGSVSCLRKDLPDDRTLLDKGGAALTAQKNTFQYDFGSEDKWIGLRKISTFHAINYFDSDKKNYIGSEIKDLQACFLQIDTTVKLNLQTGEISSRSDLGLLPEARCVGLFELKYTMLPKDGIRTEGINTEEEASRVTIESLDAYKDEMISSPEYNRCQEI